MHDTKTHPLLAQIPLTVSPFISLPTATTLPYTYKTLPSSLPSSSTGDNNGGDEKPKYVVSQSGHAAHPDDIIDSCKGLLSLFQKTKDDADRRLKAWEQAVEARELAEKRRVAPGWLDSDARILEPEKKTEQKSSGVVDLLMDSNDVSSAEASRSGDGGSAGGAELDRAFGGLDIK